MHTLAARLTAALLALAAPAAAQPFDYYVMALSWSPNWCEREGDAKNSPQCAPDREHGWILHGLWPQFDSGYPSYCQTSERPPSRKMTAGMADIMGTAGLAWHQWKKHGTCSGLSAARYFELSREAYGTVERPEILRQLSRSVRLPASVIEDAFLETNPRLDPDGVTITCKAGQIQEARICLTRDLVPIPCGADVRRDCTLDKAYFAPVRTERTSP
jgi:ribonuclease T2